MSSVKAGFHWRRSRSRSCDQKRRTLRSSENSVLIPLTTPSFTIKVETRLSESQAEAEELNQSQNVGTCIVIVFTLPFVLPTPTIWFSLDRKQRSHGWSRKNMETF